MTYSCRGGVRLPLLLPAVLVLSQGAAAVGREAEEKVPIIYSTDLLDPIDWPDDTYDLATLFAYSTSFIVDHQKVFETVPRRVENYLLYALNKAQFSADCGHHAQRWCCSRASVPKVPLPGDPLEYLTSGPNPRPGGHRTQIWAAGPLCHPAGRQIYRRGPEDYVALRPADAARRGLAESRVDVFDFVPVAVKVRQTPQKPTKNEPKIGPEKAPLVLELDYRPEDAKPDAMAFHVPGETRDYQRVMESVLINLLKSLEPAHE